MDSNSTDFCYWPACLHIVYLLFCPLASVVVCDTPRRRIRNITRHGAARDGGPVVLRTVGATCCLIKTGFLPTTMHSISVCVTMAGVRRSRRYDYYYYYYYYYYKMCTVHKFKNARVGGAGVAGWENGLAGEGK